MHQRSILSAQAAGFAVLALTTMLSQVAVAQGADRWVDIGGSSKFSNYLDTTTIRVEGKNRLAWTERRYDAPETDGDLSYDRVAIRTAYDCGKGEKATVQFVYYLRDSVVSSAASDKRDWSAPVPGSVGESEFGYVCGTIPLPKPVSGGPSPQNPLAWRLLEDFGSDSGSYSLSIQTKPATRKGPISEIWTLEAFRAVQHDSSDMKTAFNQQEWLTAFDCVKRQLQLRRLVEYLDGRQVSGWAISDRAWEDVVPDSIGEIKWAVACRDSRKDLTPRSH